MRNSGKTRFKRTKIDELMNYMVYTVRRVGGAIHLSSSPAFMILVAYNSDSFIYNFDLSNS